MSELTRIVKATALRFVNDVDLEVKLDPMPRTASVSLSGVSHKSQYVCVCGGVEVYHTKVRELKHGMLCVLRLSTTRLNRL